MNTWNLPLKLGANGSFLDGERFEGEVFASSPKCLRLGLRTLLVPVPDVTLYREHPTRVETHAGGDPIVIGPLVAAAYAKLREWAAAGHVVLIRGETGTGKHDAAAEYARAAGRPMHAMNVSTTHANIAPSTLFGAKKGSYSGADADREGWFGAAHGKVLFLDEIGELPLDVQPMLLHAVETGEIVPVGATVPRKVDVRIVAATHVDLDAAVRAGKFRADLLGRLSKRSLTLPPLRERSVDMAAIVTALVARDAAKMRRTPLPLTARLVEACILRDWPRNVRELDSVMGMAFELAVNEGAGEVDSEHAEITVAAGEEVVASPDAKKLAELRRAFERTGKYREAAAAVGMAPSTAYAWLTGKRR